MNLDVFVEDRPYIFESLKAIVINNRVLIEGYMDKLLGDEEVIRMK